MALARLVRPLAALLLFVSSWSSPAHAQRPAPTFDSLYVFGDSLVDVGNVWHLTRDLGIAPAPPPSETPNLTYYRGRFSNGPVAVEYLWKMLSGIEPDSVGALRPYVTGPWLNDTDAVDFAFGGTGTEAVDQTPGGLYAPGLKGQVELFRLALAGRQPSAGALYVVVTGANDYRDDAYNVPMDPRQVVANIAESVLQLYQLGAREVLVMSLPDLGALPYLDPAAAAAGTALSDTHNRLLRPALARLGSQTRGANIRYVAFDKVLRRQRALLNAQVPALDTLLGPIDPALLPPMDPVVPIPMSACLFVHPITCRDVPDGGFDIRGFLFWDVLHPTTEFHRALADYLYDRLHP